MKNILIIGATSAMAEETAKLYAQEGSKLFLLGRNTTSLNAIRDDLNVRGAKEVWVDTLDVNKLESHESIIETAFETMTTIDVVLIAHGTLPNQKQCEENVDSTLQEIQTNAISTISLLTLIANKMEPQNNGCIAVITSVAGDRGRKSNYVYGSSKKMVSTFLQGLRGRLFESGIHVIDIKPGFVDTPMTSDFKKGALWATPDKVAKIIVQGIEKKKTTIYAPFFWRPIMSVIKSIPESLFKRTNL